MPHAPAGGPGRGSWTPAASATLPTFWASRLLFRQVTSCRQSRRRELGPAAPSSVSNYMEAADAAGVKTEPRAAAGG